MLRKKLMVAITGLFVVLMFAGSVYAEGSWTSFIGDAREGFYSRWWNDKNLDHVSTYVQFTNCTADVEVILWRGGWWHTNLGMRPFSCVGTTVGHNWGIQPANDYRFEIDKIIGASTVSVQTVYVEY